MSQTTDTDDTPLDFLFPLRGTHTRTEAVTAQIAALGGLSRQAVRRRVLETDKDRRLERETLVAVVRGFRRAGLEDAADAALETLLARIGGVVRVKIGGWAGLTREDKADAERQMLSVVCERVCDLRPGQEFWECNFTWCLRRRLFSLLESLTKNALPMTDSVALMPGGEVLDRIAEFADPAEAFHDAALDDLVALVSGGSAKKSRALHLKLNKFSDEEIAGMLGVTTRTLRNWNTEAAQVWLRLKAEE